jgi:hypothetical protein
LTQVRRRLAASSGLMDLYHLQLGVRPNIQPRQCTINYREAGLVIMI